MTITVAAESPLSEDMRRLIAQLNATLLALTPAEYCSHMTVEQMAGSDTTVFVARAQGAAVACGALRRHPGGIGEVKRMYTEPAYQSRGVGARILGEIEALAQREGLQRLVLETGHRHAAAWRLYERAGFARCPPVLDYPPSAYSVFYAKTMGEAVDPGTRPGRDR
ncbi:MAG TPA: GNAT family N-acetyltransferase [Hyphomicrobiaceae bacterium]|jgi:putative acetyltransferase|nr:GNAT family N-acetyltransferase [Hyphomicrobiaceae bacterium]